MKRNSYKIALWLIFLAAVLSGCSLFDNTPPIIESKSPVVEYNSDLNVSDIADVTDDYSVKDVKIQEVVDGYGNISENGDSVIFDTPGEYHVLIAAKDQRGNSSEMECPITVADTTSPIILSVNGDQEIGYGKTLSLVDVPDTPDALFVDYEDISDVSLAISFVQKVGSESAEGCYDQESEDSITFQKVGEYILTLEATDTFGNSSSEQVSISAVDKTPPVISGLSSISLSEYDSLPSLVDNVTAEDEIDGDLTQYMSVNSSGVKEGVPGTYKVFYTVADTAGNTVTMERGVLIEDTTPPTLRISKSSVSVTVGGTKPDYRSMITASDAIDGDLASRVTVDDSGVEYSTPGTYKVKYSVTDKAGNTTTKTLKVTVKAQATRNNSGGGGGTVYITRTGSKYHRSGCRYLSRSKIAISRSSAISRGYGACSVCRP